jgi:hypothetical protein
LRTGRNIPATRPLLKRYSIGFSIAAGLWFESALVLGTSPCYLLSYLVEYVLERLKQF